MSNEINPGGSNERKSVLKGISQPVPRTIPVIVLADTSSSMGAEGNAQGEDKIGHLNKSLRTLIEECKVPHAKGTIKIGVITFGGADGLLHMPLTAAADAAWTDVTVAGRGTPLGAAIEIAAKIMTDKNVLLDRDYRPVLVLASDGIPNDDWEGPLDALNKAGRAAEADRFAIAIGTQADRRMLERFIEPAGAYAPAARGIFEAGSEAQMRAAFQYISYLSRKRSVSQNGKVKTSELMNPDLKGVIF